MKNSKLRRALLLLASAVLLVSLSVGATLAYLTSTDAVVNTFTVGNVQIELDEAPVDENGKATDGDRVKANQYHLLPNLTYDKDPTVTVLKNSEACYVRMKVTVDVATLTEAFGAEYVADNGVFDLGKLVTSVAGDRNHPDWVWYGYSNGTYEFRYKEIVAKNTASDTVLPALFDHIVMPGNISNDNLAKLQNLEINIVAEAIQADGFTDAAAAWAAWSN